MRRFHIQGTLWANVERIIETPLFVDSSLTSMVQMADLCAYASRRYFENNELDLFNRIFNRFDQARGKVVGIRHYVGAKPCKCKVCVAVFSPPRLPPSSDFGQTSDRARIVIRNPALMLATTPDDRSCDRN